MVKDDAEIGMRDSTKAFLVIFVLVQVFSEEFSVFLEKGANWTSWHKDWKRKRKISGIIILLSQLLE